MLLKHNKDYTLNVVFYFFPLKSMSLGHTEERERTVTEPQSERSGYRNPAGGAAGNPATHRLKVSAHEAVEILLVPAIELRKQTTLKLKVRPQPDQGSDLHGREKSSRNGKCHRKLEA